MPMPLTYSHTHVVLSSCYGTLLVSIHVFQLNFTAGVLRPYIVSTNVYNIMIYNDI